MIPTKDQIEAAADRDALIKQAIDMENALCGSMIARRMQETGLNVGDLVLVRHILGDTIRYTVEVRMGIDKYEPMEMEKLIEQRERAAWEAARQSGARTHQEMCLDYVKFEHWKARNES